MSRKTRLTFEEVLEFKAQQRYEQGYAEGLAEARARARAKAAFRAFLCECLEERLGSLPEDLRNRIETTDDDEQLVTIVLEALRIPTHDELAS